MSDVENGRTDGFPSLGARAQPLESASHRRMLELPPDSDEGVLIQSHRPRQLCLGYAPCR
ncbi:MAG: hypothetical protein V3T05_09105 [Myxococcota bacterium]